MLCIKCGNKIPEGSCFCNRCGNPVVADPEPIPEPPEMALEAPVILPEAPETPAILPEAPEVPEAPAEAPANRETVIIPQVCSDAAAEEQTMNQATIVVPEVMGNYQPSKNDGLEELYPERPEKKSKTGLIVGLVLAGILWIAVIVLVILGISNNWWRTEAGDDQDSTKNTTAFTESTNPTDPGESEEPNDSTDTEELTADELRNRLTRIPVNGLYVYLPASFTESERDDNGVTFESANFDVRVSWKAVSYSSALSYAQAYEAQEKNSADTFERNNRNGTPYTVATKGIKTTVAGFYVKSGYGWTIQIVTKNYAAHSEDIVNYVTLAQVDEKFAPSVQEEVITTKEFAYQGLYLTMDDTLIPRDNDGNCIYENDRMMAVVYSGALSDQLASTSREYAQWILEDRRADWEQIQLNNTDNGFYYVSMSNGNVISLIGMYTYQGTAWVVSLDSDQGDKYAAVMEEYIASGYIVASEVPARDITAEYKDLKLPLPDSFAELYRGDEYVQFSNSYMDVFISSGVYENVATRPADATVLASQHYVSIQMLWDNVTPLENATYIAAWSNDPTALCMVEGYYLADNVWWIVRVEAKGFENLEDMVNIAVGGIAPEGKLPDELTYRDRITLDNQSTADFEGLQISYSPNWVPDTTFNSCGDYHSDRMNMFTQKSTLQSMGVFNDLELIWKEASTNSAVWDHCEVGVAGGVYYLLLWDNSLEFYKVIGVYTDGVSCWEITIEGNGMTLVDQAIWYATAGVVLS